MPELNSWELAYWDGWNGASDLNIDALIDMEVMPISSNWDIDEQGYWAGWNAKLAQRKAELLLAYA